MAWRFEREDRADFFRLVAEDHITLDDVLAQTREGIEIVRANRLRGGLVDYSRAVLKISLYDIFKLPDLFDALRAPRSTKVAVVVPSDPQNMHKFTFFDEVANSRGYKVRLFWEASSALGWITE
jgi:hypothetical protein